MEKSNKKGGIFIAALGSILIAVIVLIGTFWTGQQARKDTESAVSSVSMFYLDELAGRREQVVASVLNTNIRNLQMAVSLLTEEDLSDEKHLQAYQTRMKKLYTLEKFAFIDTNGLIYTSMGRMDNIKEYDIDYMTLSEPQISVKSESGGEKKVIIAVPLDDLPYDGQTLVVSFMEIDMTKMLEGISLQSDNNGTTFCNIYTRTGVALTNMVLGGLAREDNLLDAMGHAVFENGGSAEKVKTDFENGTAGVASFAYNGVKETLSYTPIAGTDWMLTYLIRESIISDKISSVSEGIIIRSLLQTGLTAAILLIMFAVMFWQNKKNARLAIEKETSETENRVKRQELEQRLDLQNRLLEQEKQRTRQDYMINALASDYKSVYYVNLDTDECICYRSTVSSEDLPKEGDKLSFREAAADYANNIVAEDYREGFMQFIEPENILKGLENNLVLSYRYLIIRNGVESYEMLRMADVRHESTQDGNVINAICVGFTDIDSEMRESMAKNRALSDALNTAEEASKAKTAFLSNMSHEIRTPMNAIVGLDSIALSDPAISASTRDYLEKIGSSANHLLGIINDILDMSRIESGHLVLKSEDFSFSELIKQINTIFSSQCAEKGLSYISRINGEVDDYYIGDSAKLRQILVNILGNAVKFTPESGSVKLTIERIAQFSGQSTLRFEISDTGIGISEDYLPHIFDTFSQEDSSATNRYGSSGLGMAITKNLVEMMNGALEVESEKGKGSTFTVTITLRNSDHKKTDTEEHVPQPHEMSVLVVDDDPIACEHAKLVLEQAGACCETALSGKEAIEAVSLHHARQSSYNLILVDLKMPEMDGVETAKAIRDIVGTESAIIIITAYKWDDVLDAASDAGVDSFIAKPLLASDVIEEYQNACKRKNITTAGGRSADLNGRHVLLAEDIPINSEIMKVVLASRGVMVDVADNGRIAVEKFKESDEWYYDAVLMDIRMPEMDGLEAAAAIRALNRDDAREIPIIALTANAFDEDVQRSLQAGMNAHLSKPIDSTALFTALGSIIKDR